MPTYGVIAFYREASVEVVAAAEAIRDFYRLDLRYEKLPAEPKAVVSLSEEDTVLCILNREGMGFLKLLKYVYALNKPVLIVRSGQSLESYHHLKVPVGYLPENKEKVVWVNFFQRNNPASKIELIIPLEKDEEIAGQVHANVEFIERVFRKSGATYQKTFRKGGFEKNLKEAFKESGESMIFIMRPFRIFSFQVPLTLRLFRKYAHTATLIIPRDDTLYVPCH